MVRLSVRDNTNHEVPLWPLQLVPDAYELRHGGSRIKLQVVDGIAETAGPGAGTVRYKGCGSVEVVGTSASLTLDRRRRPITVPAPVFGESVVLVGPTPHDHLLVELPRWLSTYAGFEPSWRKIDAWPDFEAVWCFARGMSEQFEAGLLNEIEPSVIGGATGTQWARLIAIATLDPAASDTASALWDRYRKAAGIDE